MKIFILILTTLFSLGINAQGYIGQTKESLLSEITDYVYYPEDYDAECYSYESNIGRVFSYVRNGSICKIAISVDVSTDSLRVFFNNNYIVDNNGWIDKTSSRYIIFNGDTLWYFPYRKQNY